METPETAVTEEKKLKKHTARMVDILRDLQSGLGLNTAELKLLANKRLNFLRSSTSSEQAARMQKKDELQQEESLKEDIQTNKAAEGTLNKLKERQELFDMLSKKYRMADEACRKAKESQQTVYWQGYLNAVREVMRQLEK